MSVAVFVARLTRRNSLLLFTVLLFMVLLFIIIVSFLISAKTGTSSKNAPSVSLASNERRTSDVATPINEIDQFRPQLCEGIIHTRSTIIKGSQPRTTKKIAMASDKHGGFDPAKVLKLFCACHGEEDAIFIDSYIDAYEELCKLFRLFGTIFGFVTSDVEEKIGILRDYHHSDHSQHYKTVQSMLNFELTNNFTDNKKKPSGARTLLRLHRAMEFISAFLQKLRDGRDSSVKFSSLTCEAYDTTLAKHHPWLIRKAVHVALYMLPTRQDLLRKMGVEDNETGMQGMSNLTSELNIIFDIVEKLYAKDSLLDLP